MQFNTVRARIITAKIEGRVPSENSFILKEERSGRPK